MKAQLIAGIVAALALAAGLGYLNSRLERANEADELGRQVDVLTEAAVENAEKVKALAAESQANRLQAEEFNRKWSNLRAEKNRPVCQLDAGVIGLLKSASAGDPR